MIHNMKYLTVAINVFFYKSKVKFTTVVVLSVATRILIESVPTNANKSGFSIAHRYVLFSDKYLQIAYRLY